MNTVDILVGKRIRARRRSLGMSQSELGKAIGVKFQQVQKYETAFNRVSASRLWAIAEVLGIDVVHFFEGIRSASATEANGHPAPKDDMAYLSDPELLELVNLYCVLPTRQKRALLAVVRSMGQSELANQAGSAT